MQTPFEDLSLQGRFDRLDRAQAHLDWQAINTPAGGVILHLRTRAAATRSTAKLFLAMLVLTILTGLFFYLGLPFWQTWADGRHEALEETQQQIQAQKSVLDGKRNALLLGEVGLDGQATTPGLPEILKSALTEVPSGIETQLQGVIVYKDRLFVFGEQGNILRIAVDSTGFEEVPTSTKANLWRATVYRDRLFVFGAGGTVLRLAVDGARFEQVPTNTKADIGNLVIHGDRLFFLDGTSLVHRLTKDEASFEAVPSGADGILRDAIVHTNRLFVFGQDGTIRRLAVDGKVFEGVSNSSHSDILEAITHNDRLFVFGENGEVGRMTIDGIRFDQVQNMTNATFWKAVSVGNRLYVLGNGGSVHRLGFDGMGFENVPTGANVVLRDVVAFGGRVFTFGLDGTIHRLNTDGTQFDEVPFKKNTGIWDAIVHNERLFVFGLDGTVGRLSTDGNLFEDLPTGTEENLWRAISYAKRLFFVGDAGQVIASANTLSDMATLLPADSFEDSLDSVAAFFNDTLPAHIRNWSPVQTRRDDLQLVESERVGLERIEGRVRKDLSELAESPFQYLRDRKALDFKAFLDGCRGEAATADITTACLTAWQSERAAGQRSWWETLADQVPPGILLLFLLATLGGLYRYNLRLAGFHESRADALQLLAQGRDVTQLRDILAATPGEAVNLATLFLAADKVEMGTIKAKLGQAEIELAKALNSSE